MCAVYGFLDYGKKINHKMLMKILRELSIAAEVRGIDATGISYVRNGEIVTFKKAVPAHKMKLFLPVGTTAVIGHNRLTTQGSEKKNYNNHPFEGRTDKHNFALAHNGILYNDKEIKRENNLPKTPIETDSYVAVQLLEQQNCVNSMMLQSVAETVWGSFVFTVLRDDNTLFLVKGDNPLTIYHYPELGLYLYASTTDILKNALKLAKFKEHFEAVPIQTGEIIQINSDGKLSKSYFEIPHCGFEYEDDLTLVCNCFGVDRDDVEFLCSCGYTSDEIEELLLDSDLFEEVLKETKTLVFSEK